MRRSLFFSALLLSSACAAATAGGGSTTTVRTIQPPDPATSSLLKAEPMARDIACDLSDRIGPRSAGSANDPKAVAWAVAKMKELGLSNVHTEPVTVPHWERGPASATLIADGVEQPLAITALGHSVSTPPGGIEAPVLEVPSLEALDAMAPDAAKGKIVFFDKPMPITGRDAFKGYGAAVDVRFGGATAAAKHGALASVIRSIATGSERFPHTGMQRYGDGVEKIPTAALAAPDADLLHRRLAAGADVRLRLTLEAKDFGTAPSADVIGEVPGTTAPDEIVVIGAHLDAWDLGRGAIDDGAGVGVVLDVAHALLRAPSRRTVRVVLFANEETGGEGAKAYAAAHAGEMAKHQAALEIDAGDGKVFGLTWNAAPSAKPLFDGLAARLAFLGVGESKADSDAGGADTSPLRPLGVPTLDLEQDGTRYFDVHHTADDVCEKIVAADLAQVRDATLLTTKLLADAPALLDRVPRPSPSPTATSK